jgi:hypothetical protein
MDYLVYPNSFIYFEKYLHARYFKLRLFFVA